MAIEQWHELDDTLGHRKLAVLLGMGKNRVKRVMHKYGLVARRKRTKYVYPGKASQVAPNLVRGLEASSTEALVFSDIFEVRLADGTRVRVRLPCGNGRGISWPWPSITGCPPAWSSLPSSMLTFAVPGAIWHSDQGKQYGAEATRQALLEKGFHLSDELRRNANGDNGYAERFVGLFKFGSG